MKNLFNLSHISAGFTAVLIGYTSSIAIIIQVATSAGATAQQMESWLLILGLAMGVTSFSLSWFYKMPILTAWSTPGAAMLITAVGHYQMPEIIGAFVVSGGLIVLTGLIQPLKRLLEQIPSHLATAMLAGILLPFCIGSFETLDTAPMIFAFMFSGFLLAKRYIPKYAMLVLLVIALVIFIASGEANWMVKESLFAKPSLVSPEFDIGAIINLSIPLYLITMLSQNLPGIAIMKSYYYETPVTPVLAGTGLANILTAPFGGFSVNLAAISSAICMTEEVDSDSAKRYRAVMWAGVFYVMAGLFATSIVALFLAFPPQISKILAGLALLSTLVMCLQSSFKEVQSRDAALLTFLVVLSDINISGVNAALLGLLIGLIYLKLFTPTTALEAKQT